MSGVVSNTLCNQQRFLTRTFFSLYNHQPTRLTSPLKLDTMRASSSFAAPVWVDPTHLDPTREALPRKMCVAKKGSIRRRLVGNAQERSVLGRQTYFYSRASVHVASFDKISPQASNTSLQMPRERLMKLLYAATDACACEGPLNSTRVTAQHAAAGCSTVAAAATVSVIEGDVTTPNAYELLHRWLGGTPRPVQRLSVEHD